MREISPVFALKHSFSQEKAEGLDVSFENAMHQVREIRAVAMARQGKLNARLSITECLKLKSWSAGAQKGLQKWEAEGDDILSLAQVAFTVSDARGSQKVEEEDLLESCFFRKGR